jgi:cyclophilin family peptidyl-prolyl cis-trans isomerase
LNAAARALFREPALASDEIMPTPKKNRKSTRHGVFAMGNFAVESGTRTSQLQIFTDSRDNVPERDTSDDNPFLDYAPAKAGLPVKQVDGTSKRRKLTTDRKKDAQVEEAIKNDEGMVYVL